MTEDDIFPTLSLIGGDDVYITLGETYEELGVYAEDAVDGNISHDVLITGSADTSRVANYPLSYFVENSRGIISEIVTRDIIVLPEDSSDFFIGYNDETRIHVSQTSTSSVQFTDLWNEGDPSFITPGITMITAQSAIGVLEIVMPSDMTVTPSGDFDGSMMLPRALTEEDLALPSGAPLHAAFEIGLSESSLVFDRGIRILFPGQGNRLAGTQHLGVFTPISTVCDADTQDFADTLPEEGDCAITVGEDLVVWTKHFSAFSAYGEGESDDTPAPRSSNARRYSWRQSPQKPTGGCQDPRAENFDPTARHGGKKLCTYASPSPAPIILPPTSNASLPSLPSLPTPTTPCPYTRTLVLGMEGEDVRALQVFLNAHGFPVAAIGAGSPGLETLYFGPATRAALIRYQASNGIALSQGAGTFGPRTTALVCAGTTTSPTPASPSPVSSSFFTRDLTLGSMGEDVAILQRTLIANDYVIPAGATAYFGPQTAQALAQFQEDHGVSPSLGFFGALTRAFFVNSILIHALIP
jgi:peptidoglycan hydrolase-like protein with peptidoglycan-binding domain